MALTQVDREEIAMMIAAAQKPVVCTAENPHQGRLHYAGNKSGEYLCECGMRYQKDGRGRLREAAPLRPLRPVG